jgi:hypothetical protein
VSIMPFYSKSLSSWSGIHFALVKTGEDFALLSAVLPSSTDHVAESSSQRLFPYQGQDLGQISHMVGSYIRYANTISVRGSTKL